MRHRTNKVKFKSGQDANSMLMRKLMYNFLRNSHIKTTASKGKALKTYLDRLVSKSREKTEANKNYVLQYFQDKEMVNALFDQVGPAVSKINGGYVKIVRLNPRMNDAVMQVEVQWAHPVVINWENKKEVKEKSTVKIEEKKPAKVEKPVKTEKKVTEVTK